MNPVQLLEHFDRISEAPNAVARLRRLILDLAVRGKLVEQDSNDEPATELLKRIQAEKALLLKEGKIKESKVLNQITATAPYKLPTTWQWIPLGVAVNSHLGGGTPSKNNSAYWDGDIYWASVKDIGKGKYVDETIDRITEAGLADSSSNLIPPGNLIVVTRMGLGKISINRIPLAINQDLRALSLSSLVAIDYYYNFFKIQGFEGSGLTVKGIKVEELLNIPFPLPPLAEQYRIVAKVDELMVLCDQLEAAKIEREARRDRLVAASLHHIGTAPLAADEAATAAESATPLLDAARFHLDHLPHLTTRPEHIKQLRQTILNLAVRGRLVPQDPNEEPAVKLLERVRKQKKVNATMAQKFGVLCGEDLLTGWIYVDLADYALEVSTGPFGSALHQSDYIVGGIPLVNPSHMIDDRIVPDQRISIPTDIADRLSSYRLEPGDIVMARRGEVGRAALVELDQKGWLCGTGSFFLRFSPEINRYYFLLLLRSTQIRSYLAGKAVGTTMVNLNHSILKKTRLAIPPLAEQYRIVVKVHELMARCDQLETQLTATQTHSRRLLEAALHEALAAAA